MLAPGLYISYFSPFITRVPSRTLQFSLASKVRGGLQQLADIKAPEVFPACITLDNVKAFHQSQDVSSYTYAYLF